MRLNKRTTSIYLGAPVAALLCALLFVLPAAWANTTAQTPPFSQDWSNTGQISKNNNWDNVPGVVGYLGGDITTFSPGADPQATVQDGAPTGLNVTADQTNPNTNTSGGVAEFQIANPTVALQPTDTRDVPHIVVNLNTTGKKNVTVSYLLRDIDGSADNAQQQTVLQYRVGNAGNYTNLPAGYVADATTGPSLATKTTPVSVALPAAAENKALVQVRVGSGNAVGTDEWVGVDNLSVSSAPGATLTSPPASANEGETKTYDYTVSDTDPGDTLTVKDGFPDCGTGGTLAGTPTKTSTGGSFQCRFPDGSASPNVRVAVTDSRGLDSTVASQGVTVSNVAPSVTLSGPATADEGATKAYDFAVTDPGQDAFSMRSGFPDCGTGGTFVSGSLSTKAGGGTFECRYPDGPANPTVRMQVADEDGAGSNVASQGVTVANVAPAVTLNGPTSTDEGETKAYTYSIADPGEDPNPTVAEDCGANARKTDTPQAGGFDCAFPDGPAGSTVAVSATDGDGGAGDRSLRVDVANVAPTAGNDPAEGSYGAEEDTALSVAAGPGVLANDADRGDDRLTARKLSDPARGTVRLAADGSFVYQPAPGSNGDDSFTYETCDEDGACSPAATARLSVSPVNDTPANGVPGAQTTDEDTDLVFSGTNAISASDPDNGTMRTTVEATNGTLALKDANRASAAGAGVSTVTVSGTAAEIQAALDGLRFEPGADFNGEASLRVSTDDEGNTGSGGPLKDEDTVAVTVAPVNDAPTAGGDSYATGEDEALRVPSPGVLGNDADADGDVLRTTVVEGPARGELALEPDGSFVYTPGRDANGADGFVYRDGDGSGGSATARAGITVNAANDAPVVDLNGGAAGTGSAATFTEGGGPVAVVADGGALGVSDVDDAEIESAAVTLLNPRDGDAETLAADALGTGISAAFDRATGRLALSGPAPKTDYERVLRTVAYENTSQNPSTADRNVAFVVNDGDAGSGEATATVAVRAVNDAPTISDIPDAAIDEDASTEVVPFKVGDVDTLAGDLTLSGSSDDTGLVPDAGVEFGGAGEDRTVRVTPVPDRYGKAGISVSVNDGAESASDAFVLTVRDTTPPEAPIVDLDAASDTGASDTDNFTADDTPALSGRAEAGSEVKVFDGPDPLGTVTAAAGGDWTYQVPAASALADGEHRVTATATDEAGNTSAASGALNVVVDRRAPDVVVDGSPHNPTNAATAAFKFSSDDPDAVFECFVDTANFEPCSSPKEYTGLADGEHAFEVRAVDRAGNTDPSPAMRTWTVDTQAPTAALTAPAEGALLRGEVRLAAEASDDRALGKVEFLVDGEAVDVDRGGPYEFDWDTMGVADGEHALAVRATDEAGTGTTSAVRTVRVDNTAPDTLVQVSPNDPISRTTAGFEFSSDGESSSFECSFGDGPFEACSSPKEYPNLSDGRYLFVVRAVDEAGNKDETPAERVVIVDTRAPAAPSIQSPAEGGRTRTGAFTVSGTAEPGSRVRLFEGAEQEGATRAGDGGAWSIDVAEIDDGEHAYTATAADAAGNESESSAVRTVFVETTPPEVRGLLPGRDTTGVSTNTDVEVTFSKRIDEATLEGNFAITQSASGDPVPAVVGYDTTTETATLDPGADLDFSTAYTVTVRGGENGVKDRAGNALATTTWSFTTAEEPDTTPPAAPTIEGPAEDSHDNDGVFVVSGTAEPNGRVRLFEGAEPAGGARADEAGAWSVRLADVPEGRHAYGATVTDAAGNESGRSAERTVVVDLKNPDTLIDSSPHNFTNDAGAVFRFSSPEEGAGFECSLDNGPFEPCSSPLEYTGLADGEHAFEVRAIDRAGNTDPSEARRSFTVDRQGPAATLTAPAEGALLRGEVRLAAEASDDRALSSVEFLVDGEVVDTDRGAPYAFGWDSVGVADGGHRVQVRATDEAGNRTTSEVRTVRVDNTAPDTRIDESPDLRADAAGADAAGSVFRFSSDDATATFECSVDGGAFEPCASPASYGNLSDGEHLFGVRAVDEAGNRDDTPAERRFTVDATPPEVRIDAAPAGTIREGTARIAFSSEAGATFRCSLDGGAFEPCESPAEYAGLADGRHAFGVTATDRAGNTGPAATAAWTVDTTPLDATAPTVTRVSPTGTRGSSRSVVVAAFSEKLDSATVNNASFKLVKRGTVRPVAATVRYDTALNRAILKPNRPLVRGAIYTATVTTAVKDPAGNPLAANKVWRFRVR